MYQLEISLRSNNYNYNYYSNTYDADEARELTTPTCCLPALLLVAGLPGWLAGRNSATTTQSREVADCNIG